MMLFFFIVALARGSGIVYGTVPVVAAAPAPGDTLVVGTVAQELTPRLLISVESSGIPARVLGVADDVEVEADDEATLVAPEPHIPDNPAVVVIPEVADNPEVADIPDGIADAAPVPDVAVAIVEAVAGGAAPFNVTPPPS
jgi:hypothetical protein